MSGELDAGHLLPAEVWLAVVEGAEARALELARPVDERGPLLAAAVDRTITARSHGGAMVGGPRLGVIHSAETPLRAGYAYSIAANWFATKATTSATVMIDPAETVRLLPDDVVAWHCGPKANGFSVGVEQAGYASTPRAEWLDLAGRAQMRRVAEYMVDVLQRWGVPLRWATDEQIRAAAAGAGRAGWCTHDDIRRVLGGTTHTDPGGNYPRAELMTLAVAIANGADTPEADDIMATLTPADEAAIKAAGGLVEAVAQRARQVVADGSRPYGLDRLRDKLDKLAAQVALADANDDPQTIANALAPIVRSAVVDASRNVTEAGGTIDAEQLGVVVEQAVREVLGGLDDAAVAG